MIEMNVYQNRKQVSGHDNIAVAPLSVEYQRDETLAQLLANLSADRPWGERQRAARKLGYMRSRAALPALLSALPDDPFWMVRCAMIQALEKIGDPRAVPTLRRAQASDRFQVVRSHAAKAIGILSQYA